MKAIILAAGMGTRISRDIEASQKCLLDIPYNNTEISLLRYTIQTLKKVGISHIHLVTGYKHRDIEAEVKDLEVSCVHNPFYELMNSIGSLWFCEFVLNGNDDMLIFNADTYLDESFYLDFLSNHEPMQSPLLLVDSSRKDSADVKVSYRDGYLEEYGKEISVPAMAESTDIFVLPKSQVLAFRSQLLEMLENKMFDTWWESALIFYKHLTPIMIKDLQGIFWSEIDYLNDYKRIRQHLTSQNG